MAKLHYRPYNPNQIILFPQRIDEDIAGNDPVRIISAIIDQLDLSKFHKLYHGIGRCAYHPRMMLKVIVYAYMNNIYSCRKIEKLLHRDIHFICYPAVRSLISLPSTGFAIVSRRRPNSTSVIRKRICQSWRRVCGRDKNRVESKQVHLCLAQDGWT